MPKTDSNLRERFENIEWKTSRAGNTWTKFENCTLTIFSTDLGYKGICVSVINGNEKLYTDEMDEEDDIKEELFGIVLDILEGK